MKFHFFVRFHTRFGQSLLLTGDMDELGHGDVARAVLMEYLDEEFWHIAIELGKKDARSDFTYKYILKNEDGELLHEWGHDRQAGHYDRACSRALDAAGVVGGRG